MGLFESGLNAIGKIGCSIGDTVLSGLGFSIPSGVSTKGKYSEKEVIYIVRENRNVAAEKIIAALQDRVEMTENALRTLVNKYCR